MHASRPPPQDTRRLALLVLRCQAGDESAFARLFQAFAPRTLAYLRRLVEAEAEDIQQEVWLTVYRQLPGLADPGVFRTWLYRLTRNRAIDALRKLRRARELFAEAEGIETVPDLADPTGETAEPDLLDELLDRLPPLQREAMVLRIREELSYEEIASITGSAVGTVRSRLFYARRRLEELSRSDTGRSRDT